MLKHFRLPLFTLAAALCCPPGWTRDPLVLALNYNPYALHLGIYAAKEERYFADAGIDVEIQRGHGASDTARRVALGTARIGLSDAASVIAGRANGLKIKLVASLLERPIDNIYFWITSGIHRPADLEGHTLAAAPGEASLNLFPVFATHAGFNPRNVELVSVDVAAKYAALLSHRVDAIAASVSGAPLIERSHTAARSIGQFSYGDYGLDYYSIGLIASDDDIGHHGDLLKRVVGAALRGYAFALAHPDAAVADLTRNVPELDPTLMRAQWDILVPYLFAQGAPRHRAGVIDAGKMRATLDLLRAAFDGAAGVRAADLFSNDSLPEVEIP